MTGIYLVIDLFFLIEAKYDLFTGKLFEKFHHLYENKMEAAEN
jgi:hypothetical protein